MQHQELGGQKVAMGPSGQNRNDQVSYCVKLRTKLTMKSA